MKSIPDDAMELKIDELPADELVFQNTINLCQPDPKYWETFTSPTPNENLVKLIEKQACNKVHFFFLYKQQRQLTHTAHLITMSSCYTGTTLIR